MPPEREERNSHLSEQRPVVLIVLDGWGTHPRIEGNAIVRASTPNMDTLAQSYPSTTISISGLDVGLPEGQMGNSEVGHMHLGSGRTIYQDITLIHRSIHDGSFFSNTSLLGAFKTVKESKGRLHLMGLLGYGGVHSYQRHLDAILELAGREKVGPIFLHLFLDGRDTSPTSGERFLLELEEKLKGRTEVQIATLSGRYYAMDRDGRWERSALPFHSYQRHLDAILELAGREKVGPIFLHLFLDGRDTPPTSGERFLLELEKKLDSHEGVQIATLSGRYYAMDRDKRWERTEKAYLALTEGIGVQASSPVDAIRKSYKDQITDEFVHPTVIESCVPQGMFRDGDAAIFFNFRADRARQMTRAFIDKDFKEFSRKRHVALCSFVTLTEYDKSFGLRAAFPPRALKNILGEIASRQKIRQLRIAETEKYAHVTYFFNGGEEQKFPLEERLLVPSAKEVPTYDLKPEMSAYEVTEALTKRVKEENYGLIILNYANADMVGHTGNFEATVRACEVVDECVGRVVDAMMEKKARVIITGDHGNAEQMVDYETGGIHTAHTSNPVPLILVDESSKSHRLRPGTAIDVAPTILSLLNISPPKEMTGRCLIVEQ